MPKTNQKVAGLPPFREERIAGCNTEHTKEILHSHPMDREACLCECHFDSDFRPEKRNDPHYIQ